MGTTMLIARPAPEPPCWSCSEPMPISVPSGPIRAVPPQWGWEGAMNRASSSTYSQ